jgi:ATP-dependent Lon protease
LLKLLYPDLAMEISDADIEWAVRLAMESRRRVKEQQKRVGAMEFRNTHFSYTMGEDAVEQFVTTPELQSPDEIGTDPLPPGQIWAISPGGEGENPGLFRIEVTVGPGSGVKILNQPAPAPFRESTRVAEQNMLARARELVGDRDPRQHEFNIQMRAFDSARSGTGLGLPVLLALASGLVEKGLRGGLIAIGGLNLGGGIETVANAVAVAELAIEKGAIALLAPISARRQLNELSDDMATRLSILYYSDAREALVKGLGD